jgi:MYXO-CTERM domain-containing protein
VFPIVALNLAFIYFVFRVRPGNGDGSRDTPYAIRNWLLAQLAVVALFLPWLPNAIAQAASNATYFPGRVTWDTVVLETWRAFSGGDFPHLSQPAQPPPTGALWLALILLGAIGPLIRRRRGFYTLTLTLTLIVPLLLMSILAWDKPKFAPRYMLPSLPAFVTLAALGVDALLRFRSRWLAVVALLPMLLIPAVDLIVAAQIYFDPPIARPDTRSVAAYIDAHAEAGDAILLVGGHQWPVFEYYYHGAADVIPLPPDLLPAAQSPLDARVISQLAEIAETHPRAWLVLWQQTIADPMSMTLTELRSQARRLEVGQNFHEMSLLLFDLRGAQFAPGPQHPFDAAFADPIRLTGYDLDSNEFVAGQRLTFALYFEASGPIARNYQVLVHLIGPDGSIAAQADRIAGADSYPTSLWSTGALIRNTFDLRLPADLSTGVYPLVIGLYDAAGRLAVSGGLPSPAVGGDTLELTTIEIRH